MTYNSNNSVKLCQCCLTHFRHGFSHHYQLSECTFIFRCIRRDFNFSYKFLMKILFIANRIAPDGMAPSAASHLRLYCLPMSHNRDARLIRVKIEPYREQVFNFPLFKLQSRHMPLFLLYAYLNIVLQVSQYLCDSFNLEKN